MYLSIYLSMYLSIYLPIYLSVYLPFYLFVYLSVYLSICLSVYLSICLSIYLSTCLSINIYQYLSISINLSIYLILFHSIPFSSLLFSSVLFCSILFYSILFYSILIQFTVRIQSCAKDNFANKRQLSSKTLSFVEYANLSLYMACSNIFEMTIIGRKAISAAHSANAARSRPARREVPRGKTKFTHENF